MKIYSYIRDHLGLRQVELEVSLISGLPKIQFLGLPDTAIKESVYRIQSAFKHSGYKMPKNKQVVINLKPAYLKKNSRGLDLAIASAILWESQQVPRPDVQKVLLYGELSLKGDVLVPDDFEDITDPPSVDRFYSGKNIGQPLFDMMKLAHLADLKMPEFIPGSQDGCHIERPKLPNLNVSKEQSELIEWMAIGEHHSLLAGPPGTGKTTLGVLAASLLRDPQPQDLRHYQKIARHFGQTLSWRPIVTPHHTATPLSFIGGGGSPKPGDITRAHGGALIMDEFLEFDPKVSEALREPIETGQITISRLGKVITYPAKILLFATTNLCPCGYFIPERDFECRGRPRMCLSSIQKLSGPMLDRFHILSFSHEWNSKKQTVSAQDLLLKIKEIQKFIQKTRNQNYPNSYLNSDRIDVENIKSLLPEFKDSFRRQNAFLKVLRTIADCDLSEKIKPSHIEKAYKVTHSNFMRLKNLG